jgi:hypothetical protein
VLAFHADDTSDQWKLFDPNVPVWVNDLTTMAPGWGYWIHMTADDTLPVSY